MNNKGKIIAVCIGKKRKDPKKIVLGAIAIKDYGLKGDVHAGRDHKQVSILSLDSFKKNKKEHPTLKYGDLCENLVVDGIRLYKFSIGTKIKIGKEVILGITQVGKDHDVTLIRNKKPVESILTSEGVFASVLNGGTIMPMDTLEVLTEGTTA